MQGEENHFKLLHWNKAMLKRMAGLSMTILIIGKLKDYIVEVGQA